MKITPKNYFTLPEITMAIAILAIGLISILGVFPVAIKSGLQAVKVSESIHKARAVANIYQTFALKAPPVETKPYSIPIDNDVYKFAFTDPDNLKGGAVSTFEIPDSAKTRLGEYISDANGFDVKGISGGFNEINGAPQATKGLFPITFLNGKFQLDRVWLTVSSEFDTYFYVIRSK